MEQFFNGLSDRDDQLVMLIEERDKIEAMGLPTNLVEEAILRRAAHLMEQEAVESDQVELELEYTTQ